MPPYCAPKTQVGLLTSSLPTTLVIAKLIKTNDITKRNREKYSSRQKSRRTQIVISRTSYERRHAYLFDTPYIELSIITGCYIIK